MQNLIDYLTWRGDLSFDAVPVTEVDNLIFSLLSYIDFDGIVPPPRMGGVSLRDAAKEYYFTHEDAETRPLGLIVSADIVSLFRRLAETPRFENLVLCGYVNEVSEEREMQFAALTIRFSDGGAFVAFRGTDDTLVGWREDFNLCYLDEVPSQRKAADYLDTLDLPPDAPLWVGGHSKGGNLAVWGVVHAVERVRRQVRHVWSNDGPGFSAGTVHSKAYISVAERISVLVPEDSLVGLLLEHDENYTVIESTKRGLLQHDALTWEVQGAEFVRAQSLSKRGLRSDTVIRERLDAMTREEKSTLVRLLFTVLESTGAKTLTDLHKTGLRAATAMLRAVVGLSREEQETGSYLMSKLFFPKESSADEANVPSPKSPAPCPLTRTRVVVEFGFQKRGKVHQLFHRI